MKIMCLNGWGGTLADHLLPWLRSVRPDVLCLQEVVYTPQSRKDWLTYRDGAHVLPQRSDFLGEVAEALPDHFAVFCPAAQGELWDGDQPVPSQWGLATFVSKTIPVIGQAQAFVHKEWSPDGYGDHPRPRTAHAVRLHVPASGRLVSVTHMHGLRDPHARGLGSLPIDA
jgi:hypothetical protein